MNKQKTVYIEKTDFAQLEKWRTRAFVKYLLSQKRSEAVEHVLFCMRTGSARDNMAWDMLSDIYGEWRIDPSYLSSFIAQTLDALEFATGALDPEKSTPE